MKGKIKKTFGAMNEPEMESAQKADREVLENGATSERLNLLLGMVSRTFNLDDTYSVSAYKDKGKVMSITLDNQDFSVSVVVKDSERQGLSVS